MNPEPDVLIIGAGAGGGAVARALAPTGRSIVLLERGGFLPREAENWNVPLVYGEAERYRTDEHWRDGLTGEDFKASMYYHVGGNTKAYGSALLRLRPRDFEAYETADGHSPAWPIGYDDLAPHYDRAERDYFVHGRAGADPFDPPRSGPFPLPALPHTARVAEVADGLREHGILAFELPMGVRRSADRPGDGPFVLPDIYEALGTEAFDGFPDPTGMKADAETCGVGPALEYDNVSLAKGARVTRLVPNASGTEIESVEAEVDGERQTFRPGVVVLAAGAVNSAALLLRSRTAQFPDGLANTSGRVGRHFMRHTTSKFYAVSPGTPNDGFFQKTLAINDFYWGTNGGADGGPPLGHIHLMGKHNAFMIGQDLGIGEAAAVPIARHSVDWWVQTEDLPLENNRVTLGDDGRITLHWTPTNLAPHALLMDKTEAVLRRIGFSDFYRVPMPLRVVNHQCGTLRMGSDPAESVVTPDGRSHDLANLYVADASVFPSSAASNPTLTIVALGYRLAAHLTDAVL